MYCENCGRKYSKGTIYCEYCGAKLKDELVETIDYNAANPLLQESPSFDVTHPAQPKCWTVFAKVGFILGIITLIAAFIPYIDIITVDLCIPGIIFSALGKKVYDTNIRSKASTGLILNIIAILLSIVMFFVYFFVHLSSYSSIYWMYLLN